MERVNQVVPGAIREVVYQVFYCGSFASVEPNDSIIDRQADALPHRRHAQLKCSAGKGNTGTSFQPCRLWTPELKESHFLQRLFRVRFPVSNVF